MEYIFIGIIVGLVMGLTGAGGALVSIPLFMHLVHCSIKEATILSLIVVMIGATLGYIFQKERADFKIVFTFSLFGSISNYLSLLFKNNLPEIIIASLLGIIATYSLFNIWKKQKIETSKKKKPGILQTAIAGLFLGLVTTLTGLGGGVLLVPLLIQIFKKSYSEALPTSLLTMLFIALSSFSFQIIRLPNDIPLNQIPLLAVGVLLAAISLRLILTKIQRHQLDIWRKSIFSLVVIYSVSSVFYALV